MPLPLIVRAIITGFGYKIGTEAARWAVDRVARRNKAKKEAASAADDPPAADAADDLPEGLPSDPENPGNEPPPPPVPPVPEPV
jgi:hypothetical protein